MNKILFIADFFKDNLNGGAENNDSVLLNHLASKFNIATINSYNVTIQHLKESDFVVVSNFRHLPDKCKLYLEENKEYIIYEHDHKYTVNRDPSRYVDFIVPEDKKINISFYQNAKCVFVLSKICKDVLEKNIPDVNVHSIGCSLWSKDSFDKIEQYALTEKTKDLCVLGSSNPIKGLAQTLQYCEKNDLQPAPLVEQDYYEFLKSMSTYKRFIFLPQVLETFSRVCAEAKMLGLEVLTIPKKLGFASEDIYKLSGQELIDEMRNRNLEALSKFESVILESLEHKEQSVTAILTCYRRPEYLEEQIQALRDQTVKPDQIWLWVNHHEDNENVDFSKLQVDRVIKNDFNWKFHGRFALAQLAQTKFVALFDDDTIPGSKWFENCISNYNKAPGIYGGIGVLLKEKRYYGHERVGWSAPNEELTEVDLVGHAWFVNKSDLQYMWREEPYTWHNGEDIQLSYLCKKYGQVKTYVPPHPVSQPELFSSMKGLQYGVDDKATSRPSNHKVFYNQRDEQVAQSINNGWEPIFMREAK